MSILIASDRKQKKSGTDFLVNVFIKYHKADVIYTKGNDETITLFDRIINKLNIELDKADINTRILNQLSEKRYDVLMILKGNRIYPWTLKKIKQSYPTVKIVSWSGDNMTKWHNKSFFYHYGINYYDIVFSVNIPDYRNIEKICYKPVYYFDKRADKGTHKPLNKDRMEFKYDVLFIGSYEKDRFNTLNYLAKNGVKIDVFGNMWDRCEEYIDKNLNIHHKELVGIDYVNAISYAKITLGFLRKLNNDTQTSRTFEIPASGGFMLMERTVEHLRLFEEGKEAEFFSTDGELLKKIRYFLKNDNKREKIVKSGLNRVEESGYFFSNLASEMVKNISNENI